MEARRETTFSLWQVEEGRARNSSLWAPAVLSRALFLPLFNFIIGTYELIRGSRPQASTLVTCISANGAKLNLEIVLAGKQLWLIRAI
jgi:hypothetical protein